MLRLPVSLLFLLSRASACVDSEDVVKNHIQTKLDRSVDPCTDFYAHVCPANLPVGETVNSQLGSIYQRETEKLQTKHEEFLRHMKEYIMEFSYNKGFRKTVNDLLEVCDVDKIKALNYVLQAIQIDLNKKTHIHLSFLEILSNGPRELEFSKTELAQLLDRNEKIFFESFKDEVANKFTETPWLNNRNGTDFYLDFFKNRFSLFQRTSESVHAWQLIFDELERSSLHCKPNSTIPSFVCVYQELVKMKENGARPMTEFYMFEQSSNAFNDGNGQIMVNRATQLLTLTNNKARLYGGYGSIIGHEIMHTFYSSETDHDLLKYYFTNSSQCVTKQFAATCKEFGGNCIFSGTAITEEEDGSDLAAIRVVYSDFQKKYLHSEKSDIEGITTEQMFFYSMASFWCAERTFALGVEDTHSGSYIRVNALMSQMDEFKQAFQCAGDSRMIRSKVEHCSIFESVNGKLEQLYQNKIKEIHTKHDEFQKQLATYVFNVRKTVDDLLEACDANKTQAIRFVNATTGLQFFEMAPCEMVSYAFGFNASVTSPQKLYGYFLNVLLSGPREIEFSKSKLGQTLDKKEADFFESFREEVRNKFLETPWLKFRNGTELYLEHLESNLSLFRRDPEMLHAWEVIFDGLENHSLSCKPNSALPSFVCAIEGLVRLVNEEARPLLEFLMFETDFNAFNDGYGSIFMNRPVQFLTLTDNMARLYGSYGFVVGHEIMHTFYSSKEDEDVLKEHFTNSSQCVQKQYEKTCKEFETPCESSGTNVTNEEDGSDLAAIRLVYSDFQRNHLHKEKSDIDGVTSEQMFFYALASMWCKERNGIRIPDVHSTQYIRVNALVSQMNEFKEAFQCAEDSRMMASKVEHCAIFGSDAPQTRKTNNSTAPSTKEI
ncbi:unnamed protein product [Caenorhabditis auriculariae]|uniref:Peptidase M13 C-terminal domain-containing protein n=1 Tax=Caenorhabditis auriculariae TaxID=2777116 RepID=A0A8S1H7J1_9PELO|nr:unnamed protein product [Caenorhabditis auriculariae]